MSILFSSPSHLQPSHVHDPCTSQRLPAVVSIAYNTERAYFLLSSSHTIYGGTGAKIPSFGGAWGPRGSWVFGGCLWRRLSVVSLKYGGGSIGGAVLLLLSGYRGGRAWLLLLSVRLWPAVHRRGSLTTGWRWCRCWRAAGVGCVAPSVALLCSICGGFASSRCLFPSLVCGGGLGVPGCSSVAVGLGLTLPRPVGCAPLVFPFPFRSQ